MVTKKINCIKFNKYRKLKNVKLSYILNNTLIICIIWGKLGSKDDKNI